MVVNQTLFYKLWYTGPIHTIPKFTKKETEKTLQNFFYKKIWPPRRLIQLPIWKCGLGILGTDAQLNSPELKWIQGLLNSINVLWKGLVLYRLNLKLNSNQGLILLRQRQILRSTRHKNLQNHNNENVFRIYNAIYRLISNTDDKTQTLKCKWTFREVIYFVRLFFINKLKKNLFKIYQVKITYLIDMAVFKSWLFHQDDANQ